MQSEPKYRSALGRIYEEAKELFLRGEFDRAQERFRSIYEADCTFRDVAQIINDCYDTSQDEWIAKHRTRFGGEHGTA